MSVNLEDYILRIKNEPDIFNKALLLQHLSKEKRYKIKTLAKHLQVSSSYVCNLLRILKLPEMVRDGYYGKLVTPTHLFVLSRLHDHKDMIEVYEEILSHAYSTTELEARIREKLHGVDTKGRHASPDVTEALIEKYKGIDDRITTKVVQTRVKAKVIIEVKDNLEETTKILELLSQ